MRFRPFAWWCDGRSRAFVPTEASRLARSRLTPGTSALRYRLHERALPPLKDGSAFALPYDRKPRWIAPSVRVSARAPFARTLFSVTHTSILFFYMGPATTTFGLTYASIPMPSQIVNTTSDADSRNGSGSAMSNNTPNTTGKITRADPPNVCCTPM
jgi:hypothetical protein